MKFIKYVLVCTSIIVVGFAKSYAQEKKDKDAIYSLSRKSFSSQRPSLKQKEYLNSDFLRTYNPLFAASSSVSSHTTLSSTTTLSTNSTSIGRSEKMKERSVSPFDFKRHSYFYRILCEVRSAQQSESVQGEEAACSSKKLSCPRFNLNYTCLEPLLCRPYFFISPCETSFSSNKDTASPAYISLFLIQSIIEEYLASLRSRGEFCPRVVVDRRSAFHTVPLQGSVALSCDVWLQSLAAPYQLMLASTKEVGPHKESINKAFIPHNGCGRAPVFYEKEFDDLMGFMIESTANLSPYLQVSQRGLLIKVEGVEKVLGLVTSQLLDQIYRFLSKEKAFYSGEFLKDKLVLFEVAEFVFGGMVHWWRTYSDKAGFEEKADSYFLFLSTLLNNAVYYSSACRPSGKEIEKILKKSVLSGIHNFTFFLEQKEEEEAIFTPEMLEKKQAFKGAVEEFFVCLLPRLKDEKWCASFFNFLKKAGRGQKDFFGQGMLSAKAMMEYLHYAGEHVMYL